MNATTPIKQIATIGIFRKNIQRHALSSAKTPPTRGPVHAEVSLSLYHAQHSYCGVLPSCLMTSCDQKRGLPVIVSRAQTTLIIAK
jgi:hypothetical protein